MVCLVKKLMIYLDNCSALSVFCEMQYVENHGFRGMMKIQENPHSHGLFKSNWKSCSSIRKGVMSVDVAAFSFNCTEAVGLRWHQAIFWITLLLVQALPLRNLWDFLFFTPYLFLKSFLNSKKACMSLSWILGKN